MISLKNVKIIHIKIQETFADKIEIFNLSFILNFFPFENKTIGNDIETKFFCYINLMKINEFLK